jgi:hypothetical protein
MDAADATAKRRIHKRNIVIRATDSVIICIMHWELYGGLFLFGLLVGVVVFNLHNGTAL